MIDESTLTAQEIKNKQHRNLLVIAGIAVIVVCGIYYVMDDGSSDAKKKAEETNFVSPIEQVNTQSVWLERTQNKLKEQERQTAELKNEITQLKDNDQTKSLETDPRFVALQKQNQILQESLKVKQVQSNPNAMDGGSDYSGQVFSTTPGARGVNGQTRSDLPDAVGIDNNELNLKSNSNTPKKNKNSFVPAGTFAEAIMLGAADASAGVQAQSNPSPMLFRIVANGTLPNHQQSHLKSCVVTAAVVGDISSERGQIRLERMSCTFPNGEIVEQQVDGTVFGMDAKNGVRGNPVWREGALLGRAAIAGTLSGLGSAVSQTYTTSSISPLGSTQTVNNGDIFKYGAAQGASNAMEKLAEYNIRRAEQYHPVIQLSAGQPVDVVFLKGFYLDGRKHEETADERSEPTQLFTSSSTPTATGLTLSERELEKIKQNEEANGWVSRNQSGGL
jgi:conjugal transfer pilus assembly protein TraB